MLRSRGVMPVLHVRSGIPMSVHFRRLLFLSNSALITVFGFAEVASSQEAPQALPAITVTAPSPIVRRAPARPRPRPAVTVAPSRPTRTAAPAPAPEPPPSAAPEAPLPGTLPVVTDQFATVTVVPNEEIRRSPS